MVYERYIKRGEKIYGPYLYQSKRVSGKVISEYVGHSGKKESTKKLLFLGVVGLIFILGFFLFSLTGKITLLIDNAHSSGENLDGILKLKLEPLEIIPENW